MIGSQSHTDDIVSLAISKDRLWVATGQVGNQPLIFVWNAITALKISKMVLPRGSRACTALAFSADKHYLAVSDKSDNHAIHVFDLT